MLNIENLVVKVVVTDDKCKLELTGINTNLPSFTSCVYTSSAWNSSIGFYTLIDSLEVGRFFCRKFIQISLVSVFKNITASLCHYLRLHEKKIHCYCK